MSRIASRNASRRVGSLRTLRTPIERRLACRKYATVTDLSNYPKPGEQLHGFTLKRTKHVPELQLSALHFQHDKTGAEYLHVARDDTNNVFSIGFKTNPPDDTGVPHILEHTTLCGSEKYPIRDPFFKMLPRSLSNFMNAFTSSDHTTYPFATTNRQDFNNLMSVYLDATLHPLLTVNDFTQEGWRIGPENPLAAVPDKVQNEADKKLVFKGVVYNEMKGQMSDASYLYYIRFQDQIFPSINNSGGDPQKMTDLTHEQLKRFHAEHYHPSNAKVLTYGDMPLIDHLKEVGTRLDGFERIDGDKDIKQPISLDDGPVYVTVKGPIDPLVDKDMQFKTSTSWLMGDTSNIIEGLSLRIMTSLLMDGYGSPLYRALIETGLGPDFSPNTGFDNGGKIGIFSVGLNGVKESDVPKIKEAIGNAFQEVRQKGFDKSKVDGLLHQFELSLKHKTAHFGMGLIQRLKPGWFNGIDPFDALAWEDTVSAFKARYAEDGYLEGLLEKYLLNDKTFTFTMEPSATYGEELAAEEALRLAGKINEVNRRAGGEVQAREQLEKNELELLEVQEKARDQDLSCLPTVHVRDIPRQKEKKTVRDARLGEVSVQWREAPTNGLTYFRAVNTLKHLPDELRMLIPLFTDAIMRLGTKDMTMEQIEDLIKLKTGGISTGYNSSTSPLALNTHWEGLAFSGYALDRNVPAMFELLSKVILETSFDGQEAETKIRQLLQGAASGAVSSVAESGHSYARRFAEAGLTPQGRLKEETGGLTQVRLTASLASRPESEGLQDVVQKLKAIQSFAISSGNTMRAALTCGSESSSANESALQSFFSNVPSTCTPKPDHLPITYPRNTKSFFPLPYQVYYTSLALPTVPYIHASGAPLQILSQLLTHKHLHHEIREKGGAYGGGAYANGLGGVFGFYSYRDPNPQNTIKIIREAGTWARDRVWTDRDLEEAKLSVFQGLDAPQSVSEEGMVKFLSGVDEDMAQKRREQLLDVNAKDIKEVAQKYLIEGLEEGNLAVLGEKRDWIKEGDGWNIRDLGMAEKKGGDMPEAHS
ncbi:MAG: Mitochondrial presequence protease [Pycnora praestabilis]|nr:MAG: Mitochondrial presequence protease [Pycnora praestabilis]